MTQVFHPWWYETCRVIHRVFWVKECDIFAGGGQNIIRPPPYIFSMGSRPPTHRIYTSPVHTGHGVVLLLLLVHGGAADLARVWRHWWRWNRRPTVHLDQSGRTCRSMTCWTLPRCVCSRGTPPWSVTSASSSSSFQVQNSPFPQIFSTIVCASTHLDCLLGLYWTGLTLLNGFSFLVNFFLFILGRAVD